MKHSDKELLHTFFETYDELQELLQEPLEHILSDTIKRRALERMLGIITIIVKRLHKAHTDWQIPHLAFLIKLKNKIIWGFEPLRPSYLQHILINILPAVKKFFTEKNNNPQTNEN